MGGEMQDGILSVDETGALYVSCEVDSDLVDGSISLLANLRHLDDENWTDEDYIPMPESAVCLLPFIPPPAGKNEKRIRFRGCAFGCAHL